MIDYTTYIIARIYLRIYIPLYLHYKRTIKKIDHRYLYILCSIPLLLVICLGKHYIL